MGRAFGHCLRFRYIGSGEAASYRRLPPLEPTMASSRHVPLPVLRGPVSAASVIDYRRRRLSWLTAKLRIPASSRRSTCRARLRSLFLGLLAFRGQGAFEGRGSCWPAPALLPLPPAPYALPPPRRLHAQFHPRGRAREGRVHTVTSAR